MDTPTYYDDYSSCSETFSTLHIRHDDVSPIEVTALLNVEPTEETIKGMKIAGVRRLAITNRWSLSSSQKVESFDTRRHID